MTTKPLRHIALLTAVVAAALFGARGTVSDRLSAADFPSDENTIAHVLNRMAFGARPGDVERIQKMGVQAYIDQQLHPERIPDQAAGSRLASLTTIGLTSRDIADQFERPVLEMRRERRQGQNADQNPQQPTP